MVNPLQFAIVGCGKIAPRHAAEAARHGQLIAVCDIIEERAKEISSFYNCRHYSSIEELLAHEKPDVVSICTPNGLHAAHSIASLEAGANVLCEKPMSIDSDSGRKMMEAAKSANKKLYVVKSTRYNPSLVVLKKYLDEGILGSVYNFQLNCFWNRPDAYYANSWKGTRTLDGGTLFTQFSHYIDAMTWLFGDVESSAGFAENLCHKDVIEFEDSGSVALKMRNGTMGGLNWSINSYQKNMEISLTVLAEKASIRIGGEYLNKLEYLWPANADLVIPDTGKANDYGFYKGSMSNHDKVYENLVKALADENHPFTNAEDGLKTVETIEKIYKSVSLPA